MSAWSAEQDAELFRFYITQGMSASQCAEKMGHGRSRSAIIGRANRLGFKREGGSAPRSFKSYPKRAAPKTTRRKQQPAPAFLAKGFTFGGPIQPAAPTVAADIDSPNAKYWEERGFGECCYIVSEDGPAISCCNPCSGDYCAPHYRVMRIPSVKAGPRKIQPISDRDTIRNTYGAETSITEPLDSLFKPRKRGGAREPRTFEEWAAA